MVELKIGSGSEKAPSAGKPTEMDQWVGLAGAKADRGQPKTAAHYLTMTFYAVVFRGKRISSSGKKKLIRLAFSLAKTLVRGREYNRALELVACIYQAELAGKAKLASSQRADLNKIKIPFNKLSLDYRKMFGYALKGLEDAVEFNGYFKPKEGGKTKKVVFNLGKGEGIAAQGKSAAALFILAVIKAESRGNAGAVNADTGCSGSMQLHPGTAKAMASLVGLGRYSIFDPGDNIRLGTVYLRYLEARIRHQVGFLSEEDRQVLMLLSYAGRGGDRNTKVLAFMEILRSDGRIGWFGRGFRNKYPAWGNYIVKIIGAYRAYKRHIDF